MKFLQLAAAFAAALLFTAQSAAQCLGPDGLDPSTVPCAPASTQVPQRGFQQQALGLCWRDCGLDAQGNYTAIWGGQNPIIGPPGAVSCGWYRGRLRILNSSGLQLDGQMFFAYSRTWGEVAPSGAPIQVWRYLVNGDLRVVGNTPFPCTTPTCAAAFGSSIRFTGYVDYATECGTTLFQRAWMITHACDAIDHVAGFPRAGAFHPGRSYSFVGPAAGFVPAAGFSPEVGPIAIDCLRRWDVPAIVPAVPARCTQEEQVLTGNIGALGASCPCGVGPANWHEAQLFVAGVYGTVLSPFPGSAPFRSFQVGMWTNPAVFPGVEEVRWNCNEGQWTDCTGVTRQEFSFGATTHNGFPAFSIDANLPSFSLGTMFIDQGNSMLFPAGVPTRNRPYRTDHIVNLNM